MKIRLIHNGQKRIAIIKEIRSAYGINLKDSKAMTDRTPVDLPPIDNETGAALVRALRREGATVEAIMETTVLDKVTAASYIQTAATALGEGNIRDTRFSLRAALRLIGDFDLDVIEADDELNV